MAKQCLIGFPAPAVVEEPIIVPPKACRQVKAWIEKKAIARSTVV
jgi:hypothetical protein